MNLLLDIPESPLPPLQQARAANDGSPLFAFGVAQIETRTIRRQKVAEWKAKYAIQTNRHGDPGESKWLAVSMTECAEYLSDYELTEEEKTDLGALFAGYCALVDDAGLASYGATEYEACRARVRALEGEAMRQRREAQLPV